MIVIDFPTTKELDFRSNSTPAETQLEDFVETYVESKAKTPNALLPEGPFLAPEEREIVNSVFPNGTNYIEFLIRQCHLSRNKGNEVRRDNGSPNETHALFVAEIAKSHGGDWQAGLFHDLVEDNPHLPEESYNPEALLLQRFELLDEIRKGFGSALAHKVSGSTNFSGDLIDIVNSAMAKLKDYLPITDALGTVEKVLKEGLVSRYGPLYAEYLQTDLDLFTDAVNQIKSSQDHSFDVYGVQGKIEDYAGLVRTMHILGDRLYMLKVIKMGLLKEKLSDRLHNTAEMGNRDGKKRPKIGENNIWLLGMAEPEVLRLDDPQLTRLFDRVVYYTLCSTINELAVMPQLITGSGKNDAMQRYEQIYRTVTERYGSHLAKYGLPPSELYKPLDSVLASKIS
jgi:hypothetical protein